MNQFDASQSSIIESSVRQGLNELSRYRSQPLIDPGHIDLHAWIHNSLEEVLQMQSLEVLRKALVGVDHELLQLDQTQGLHLIPERTVESSKRRGLDLIDVGFLFTW